MKDNMLHITPKPDYPVQITISGEILKHASSAEKNFTNPSMAQLPQQIDQLLDLLLKLDGENFFVPLHHRLSSDAKFRLIQRDFSEFNTSKTEQRTMLEHITELSHSLKDQSGANFCLVLNKINAKVRNRSFSSFRQKEMAMKPDNKGHSWQLPKAIYIQEAISKIPYFLSNCNIDSAILRATVVYVIINWTHPYSDGNGRTSRIVFNALLLVGGMHLSRYIPIKELSFFSERGHDIRLRYTIMTQDYSEIVDYFINLIDMTIALEKRLVQRRL